MSSPATPAWIKPLFLLAALYDGILGLAFLTVPLRIYAWMNVPPPNHPGYIQFPAAMLIIFGYAFWMVAMDPMRRRDIIWLGCLLKIAYCSVVFAHAASAGGIPIIWTIFAIADLLFLLAFIAALRALRAP
jgi:hypothetical protein